MNCKENCKKKSNRNDKGEKMRKITDLRGIKDTAKVFLHMNIEETKFSPLVIKHPFTDSAMVCLSQTDGEIAFANIMEDTKAFTLWKEQVEKQIDTAKDVFGVYHLVPERNPAAKPFLRSKNTDLMTKSYLLAFLKYTESYLSREDFSKMLADIWIRTEAPNLDPNFKQKELLDLFRKSKQEEMMTEDEIETLRSLPETVSVYRGVTSYNAGKVKALSWTLDQKVAQWFANRFGENGTVYEAEISKEHILALFKGRNEWEVIVEPDHLLQLSEALEENMEEPQL